VEVATRSVEVTGTLKSDSTQAMTGMFVTVRTAIRDHPDSLVVPRDAVVLTLSGSHVFRVRDGAAEQVPVEVVLRQDTVAVVAGALEPGDQVVTEGLFKLSHGTPVRVVGATGS
jgi:multidrug efflux pump subunit AcrA (membrane-fusion protein)